MELGIGHLRGAVAKLREFSDKDYAIAFITGSGLGEILDMDHVHFEIPYSQIPFFPVSTVEGHLGKLFGGNLLGKDILLFKGRFHLYEGHKPSHIAFPIWVSKLLGAKYLFITSASGGLNLEFRPGDLMLIKDHINLTGKNPLTGPNIEELGTRFPDMTAAYDPSLQSLAREVANAIG
ncbi:MAG: purine-nucleoside phosphorylase, partial [Desulfatiglandales bacterium]